MILIKTELGQRAFKERTVALTPRQRSAFILFDGKRTVSEVLAATATMGITEQDIQWMRDEALLNPVLDGALSGGVSGGHRTDGGFGPAGSALDPGGGDDTRLQRAGGAGPQDSYCGG